jgi:hypothetical protein
MGTHYSVRVPLTPPVGPEPASVIVAAEFLDALTGAVHRAERVIRWNPRHPRPDTLDPP